MPKVVHFEVSAKNVERASAFYQNAFNWRTRSWEGPSAYTFLITGQDGEPGIDGAVIPEQESFPRVLLTLDVPSVEDAEQRVVIAGGKIIRPNHLIGASAGSPTSRTLKATCSASWNAPPRRDTQPGKPVRGVAHERVKLDTGSHPQRCFASKKNTRLTSRG